MCESYKLDGTEMNEFLKKLLEEEKPAAISQEAFAPMAGRYHIGRIEVTVKALSSVFSREEMEQRVVLFRSPEGYREDLCWSRDFATGENEEVLALVYPLPGTAGWSDSEKETIETYLSIAILHGEKYRLFDQIRLTALTNYLTGLPNAGGYLEVIKSLVKSGKLDEYDSYYYNLKSMGLFNMRFGGEEGDRIIQRYAALCREFIRPDECIAHFGGDNFVALIRRERAEEFRCFLNETETYALRGEEKIPVRLKCTAGRMRIEKKESAFWKIIAGPATALAYAKKRGIDFADLTDEMLQQANRQKEMQHNFSSALRNGEFVSFYQPKVDTETGRIVGAEALVRWIRDGVVIQPDQFIPALEKAGMTEQLDLFILEEACKNLRKWISNGNEDMVMSVNFSRRDLEDPQLSEKIIHIIEKYHLNRKNILVEMTETTSEQEKNLMMRFMDTMSEHDIMTSIDDFGTGYSSLSALRDYTVNEIKIDKSFISHNELQDKDRAIIGSIIKMAELLHVDVITEGVENMEQVQFLQDLGCTKVQGYLYGKPLPPEHLEGMLDRQAAGMLPS